MGGILYWLVIGLIAGLVTGKLMGAPKEDLLMTIITGIVGALVGGFVMSVLGFRFAGGFIYNIIVAVLGAILLTWAYRKFVARRTGGV
jgi:uncharacterized membrane protein YeaQ/YmgE (transglycosylase-associated protein family)